MAGLGLYLAGLTDEEARQLRADLASIAAHHGYTSERGPTAGEGNPAALLVAIASGEIALLLLADGPRNAAIRRLRELAPSEHPTIREAFHGLANALETAIARELGDWYEDLD